MKLKELAQLVAGEIVGDPQLEIISVASIEEATETDLVFVLEKKYLDQSLNSKAAALVGPLGSKIKNKSAILVSKPRLAMAKIIQAFAPKPPKIVGINPSATIAKTARLGKNVAIGPNVVVAENVVIGDNTIVLANSYIGNNVKLGNDCFLHANVSIYDQVEIGKRVILHSGVCLGVDGFGYVQDNKQHIKIPQIGTVIIEDDVEVYANVCISRATLGATIIGQGTKIDNLTHVAHNCKIGQNCAIVSLVGFAGSVTLEDNVYVAGQVGFKGHIRIGQNSVVMARAGVTKDVAANSFVSGFPAQDHRQETKYQAALRHLTKKQK